MGVDFIFRLGDNETGNKFEGKSKGERHVVGTVIRETAAPKR